MQYKIQEKKHKPGHEKLFTSLVQKYKVRPPKDSALDMMNRLFLVEAEIWQVNSYSKTEPAFPRNYKIETDRIFGFDE